MEFISVELRFEDLCFSQIYNIKIKEILLSKPLVQ